MIPAVDTGEMSIMPDERIKSILSYLAGKTREGFTGGIKMGFEDGKPKGFAETDNPDTTIARIKPDFKINERISMACTPGFFGTLFLVYENGEITHSCYNKTFNGQVLDKMLSPNSAPAPGKKRIGVVIKRGTHG